MSGDPRQSHELDEEGGSHGWLLTDENAARGSLGAASPAVLLPSALWSAWQKHTVTAVMPAPGAPSQVAGRGRAT